MKGGEKSYRLLAEVMQRTGRAGLAKFVLVEREYLVAVTSREGALVLTTLHYHGEIAPREEKVETAEKERMKQAIRGMTVTMIMEKYYLHLVTARMAKEIRGKVFINWSQNDGKKTMICAYSLRAREMPFVSTPSAWEVAEAPAEPMPHRVVPMLATSAREPFDHPQWLFKVKWDGYRAIAEVRDGELIFVGHAGGGFLVRDLKEIHERLAPLVSETCPFRTASRTNTPTIWVRPELVREIALSGWTDDGVMRHSVILRLREDKNAGDVVWAGDEGA